MLCKTSNCVGEVKPPGIRYCAECRARRSAKLQEYLKLAAEVYRARNRKNAGKYSRSRTARAKAYRERHKKTRARAASAWAKRNRDRKGLIARLASAVARREITRPHCCQDCPKDAGPVVAWGLTELADGSVQVEAWCCWGCWWRRRREGRA